LRFFFGDGWWGVLAVAAIGVLATLRPGTPRLLRLLAVVTVICVAGYLVTPGGALGPPGLPALFAVNLRYALPALGLALLLFAAVVGRAVPVISALVGLGLTAAATTAAFGWAATDRRGPVVAVAVALALVIAGTLLWQHVAPTWSNSKWPARAPVVAGVLAAVIAVVGYPLQHSYLRVRYHSQATAKLALFSTLPAGSGLRIGVVGEAEQYPFLGPRWQNTVHYIGAAEAHHAFERLVTCPSFLAQVSAGRYDLVVAENYAGTPPPAMAWLLHDPAATLTFRNPVGAVFRVRPTPAADRVHNGCVR
jgi:hypothetical protein